MDANELVQKLYHDLGKAIVYTQRWLPEDASPAACWEAVNDDILRTRRGPTGVFGAVVIWENFAASEGYETLLDKNGIHIIAETMEQIGTISDRLQGELDMEVLERAQALSNIVYRECLALKNELFDRRGNQ